MISQRGNQRRNVMVRVKNWSSGLTEKNYVRCEGMMQRIYVHVSNKYCLY